MKQNVFGTVAFHRGLVLVACLVSLVLGITGVSTSRDIGTRYAHVDVSAAWYLLPILLPMFISMLALFYPQRIFHSTRGWITLLLVLIVGIAGATAPLLYIVYDFDQRLPDQPTNSSSTR